MISGHHDLTSHPEFTEVFQLWQAKRGARAWPSRSEIDVVDLRQSLGRILIVDVLANDDPAALNPITYRYRLVGLKIVEVTGIDMTGRTVDDFPQDWQRKAIRQVYDMVLESKLPIAARRLYDDGKTSGSHLVLSLPLGKTQDHIDMILTVVGTPVQNDFMLPQVWSNLGEDRFSQEIIKLCP